MRMDNEREIKFYKQNFLETIKTFTCSELVNGACRIFWVNNKSLHSSGEVSERRALCEKLFWSKLSISLVN